MQLLQEVVVAARSLVTDLGLDPKQQYDAVLYSTGAAATVACEQINAIQKLARVRLEIRNEPAPAAAGGVKRSTTGFDLVLKVPAAETDVLRKRLAKEIEQLTKVIANSRRQLADEKFVSGAPEAVVNSVRQKLAEYESQIAKSRGALEGLMY
jgi:valyl-tRNA synthetase